MRTCPRLLMLLSMLFITLLFFGNTPVQGNGYTIYFESDRDGDSGIYRIDGDGIEPVTVEGAMHPSVTSDGSMLFYTRITETAWGRFWNVYYLVNGEEHRLSRNEVYDELEPVVSWDGSIVAYTNMRGGNLEIITVPMDHNELQYRVTDSEKPDEQPALSPNGEWVYWTGRTGTTSFIFRAASRGGPAERVTEDVVWEEHASLSADGRYMVYTSITDEEPEPEEADIETDEETDEEADIEVSESEESGDEDMNAKYPEYANRDPDPEDDVYSPGDIDREDGRNRDSDSEDSEENELENSDIWILDIQTGERTRLTSERAWDGHPSISSDGEVIVFTSDRDGNCEIYLINRDGTGLERLTDNEAVDGHACIV